MNLPEQRTQSVFQTWDLLMGLSRDTNLPKSVRQEVSRMLRNYPYALQGNVVTAGKSDVAP